MGESTKKLAIGVILGIAAMAAVLLPMKSCDYGLDESTVKTTVDTIPGDKVPTVSKTYVPLPQKIVYRTVTERVDTAAILAGCMAKRYYSDTLRNDGELLAVVQDTVSISGIVARRFIVQNKRPVAVVTSVYKTEKKAFPLSVNAGVFGGYLVKQSRPVFGPEILFTVNEAATFGYGYDILNNGHMAHISAKLTWKRR